MSTDRRLVPLEGCANFRDLGGYVAADGRALRWGSLFRSDGLDRMTECDADRVCELGVEHLIDLRSHDELERYGYGPLAGRVEHHHLPIFERLRPREAGSIDFPEELGHWYLRSLHRAGERIAAVLDRIAALDGATVFFCSAGKDRTGLVSAVLLGSLGVDDQTIVHDYALSAQVRVPTDRPRMRPGFEELVGKLPASYREAAPETMRTLIEDVRREFGSFRSYAESHGAGPALATIEQRILS